MIRQYDHFINGAWRAPGSKDWLASVDPATGESWARIARGNKDDVDVAVDVAFEAATNGPWGRSTPQDRAQVLFSIADILKQRWEELVESEVRDNGKRISEVRGQFSVLHHWYRYFGEQALNVRPHALDNDISGVENTAHYAPFGVIAAITPWNSPLMIAAWKVAPALAAGNAVIIKPSEHASVSTLEFAALTASSRLPAGVLGVITGLGPEVGAALVAHPQIAKVTFTGSDRGGSEVARCAASGVKPVTLELGGKSPQIVFTDADLDNAVNGVLSGIFLSNGQTCVAGSRFIVHDSIHDDLVERLCNRARALRAGDPMDPRTEIAPLANAPHRDKVLAMIATAKDQGATCMCGGNPMQPDSMPDGFYVEPTIFSGVTPDMQLWREEVFGPVLATTTFTTEEEAVTFANDTNYGLAAGIWSADQERCDRLARRINAGTIYINHYRSVSAGSPIGGFKRSGYGRELGPDAVRDFLQVKSIWRGTEPVPDPFPSRAN